MFAFDATEKAVVDNRSRVWTAVAQSELGVVAEMARCLREIGAGRWPKKPEPRSLAGGPGT